MSFKRDNDKKILIKNHQKLLNDANNFLKECEFQQKPSTSKSLTRDVFLNTNVSEKNKKSPAKKELNKDNEGLSLISSIGDENLLKTYIEGVVEEFFRVKETHSNDSSNNSETLHKIDNLKEKITKKDQAVLVNNLDIQNAKEAELQLVKKGNGNSSSPKVQSPGKIHSARKKKVLTPIQNPKRQTEKSINSSIISSKTTLKKVSSPSKPSGQYLRFVGKPRATPFDFKSEHPHLTIEQTSITSFPCRLNKSPIDEVTEFESGSEKLSAISEELLTNKKQLISTRSNNDFNASAFINKTWHEVLLEKILNDKALEQKLPECNGGAHAKKNCNENIRNNIDKNIETFKIKESIGRDIIYDSRKIDKTKENFSHNGLTVQKLPILCIRGECKVQKAVEISIAPGEETNKCLSKAENVQYFQYKHKSLQENNDLREFYGTNVNVQEQVNRAQNGEPLEFMSLPKEKTISDLEGSNEKISDNAVLFSQFRNKYLAPFILNDLSKNISNGNNENSITPDVSSGIKNLKVTESSSEDDEFLIQSDKNDFRKISSSGHLSSSTTSSFKIIPEVSEDFQANKLVEFGQKRSLILKSPTSTSNFINAEENEKNLVQYPVDVENILKEVFTGSDSNDNTFRSSVKTHQKQNQMLVIGDDLDLNSTKDMCLQTSGSLINNSRMQEEKDSKTRRSRAGEGILFEEFRPQPSVVRKISVTDLVKRICKDETEGIRNFKSRAFNSLPRQTNASNVSTFLKKTNLSEPTDSIRTVSKPVMEIIRGCNKEPHYSKHLINETTHIQNDFVNVRENNNSRDDGGNIINLAINEKNEDNCKTINHDEIKEQYKRLEEISSLQNNKFHSDLLKRKCLHHHNKDNDDEEDDANEKLLNSTNLNLSNTSLHSKLLVTTSEGSRSNLQEFQVNTSKKNSRISKTINKIFDTADNITTTKSSNWEDSAVQRAVQKFLQTLSDDPSKVSLNYNYSVFSPEEKNSWELNHKPSTQILPSPPTSTPLLLSSTSSHTSLSPSLSSGQQSSKSHTSAPTSLCFSTSPGSINSKKYSDFWKSGTSSTMDADSVKGKRNYDTPCSASESFSTRIPLPFSAPNTDKNSHVESLTGSVTSLNDAFFDAVLLPTRSSTHNKHQAHIGSISEGEVLSLGEIRDFER